MTKEYDAVLIHSYLADSKGNEKPDRVGRLCILGACELLRKGKAEKILVTVVPSLSRLIEKRVTRLLDIPAGEIIAEGKTVTTRNEIKSLKKIAEREGFKTIVTVGNKAHLPRIKRNVERVFEESGISVTTLSETDVLSSYGRYEKVLEEMDEWEEQRAYALQERILNTPFFGKLIEEISQLVPDKVSFQAHILEIFGN